jgi:beta-galactosidase
MSHKASCTIIILWIALISYSVVSGQELTGVRESFNPGWKFIKFDNGLNENSVINREPENLQSLVLNDESWRTVDLPHDWGIEGSFSDTLENNTGLLPWKAIGWYRKHFTLTNSDNGKRIYIEFEGAMANSKVWLNGKFVGEWPYGYTSFRLDLTPFAITGKENIIAVRLDTKSWDSRWYPGAGLYRNVWLVKTSQVHISYNGLYCTAPEIKKERGVLSIEAEVENHLEETVPVTIKASVFKLNEKMEMAAVPVAESVNVSAPVAGLTTHHFRFDIFVKDPVLWDLKHPELYRVKVTVLKGSDIADIGETNFGFRTLTFTARNGFYLNGSRVEVKGVCNHHDLGALGTAFNSRAAERQLEILREMGCNAIRTSHNPPAPGLLDLCDKMGFLVEDEAFDAWRIGKMPNDYNKIFNAWHDEDLRAMVRRDRNHPSVFIWSIGNEVPDQMNPYLSENLRRIVKSEDNTRPVTSGCNNGNSGTNGFQKTLDVFGINYNLRNYAKFFDLKDNDNLPIHSSESASTVSSRGEYYFPVVQGDLNNNLPGKGIFQVSSYDLAYPAWATTPDQQWEINDKFPAVFGEFVWTGFDYLGEPTPYYGDITDLKKSKNESAKEWLRKWLEKLGTQEIPSRSSYFGIMDLAGFKKDRFYLYQSRWRPDLPMAHILPHWNWPERKGLVTPVFIYTSGDEAELFLNGKSLGKKKKGQFEYRLRWDDVVYEPGELKVIAYRNGEKWAEDVMRTTGKASLINMSADRPVIHPDATDLIFITVRIEDSNNLLVPKSDNLVNFTIEGPGKIAAVDNGDATSHDSFQSSSRKAYNGMCLVIIKADKGASGTITVRGESDGLKGALVTVKTMN